MEQASRRPVDATLTTLHHRSPAMDSAARAKPGLAGSGALLREYGMLEIPVLLIALRARPTYVGVLVLPQGKQA